MVSPTVNVSVLARNLPLLKWSNQVLRWSAVVGGVAYGFVHNRTLNRNHQKEHVAAEFAAKQKVIDEAKQKWAALHAPKDGGLITDVDDPNFDLIKVIDQLA